MVMKSIKEDLPEEQLAEAWSRRAAQMARVVESEDPGEQLELAIVRLGREMYGLDVRYLYDIRPLTHLTRVPRTPPWVAGVVNLRGRIVSVLDLQRFLNLPGGDSAAAARHLAVVETPDMELALLVDEVMEIETLPVHEIQEAGDKDHRGDGDGDKNHRIDHRFAVRGIRADYVRGVVVHNADRDGAGQSVLGKDMPGKDMSGKTMLVILDLPALLADPQLIVHEELV